MRSAPWCAKLPPPVRRVLRIIKRTAVAFWNDQITQHASALTYYALMSLFPTMLLGISILGLVGQYPETYDAIVGYLRDVAPKSVVDPIDSSLHAALQNKSGAATSVAFSVVVALYGTTGVLESARRALNVVFRVQHGRSFLHRKALDVAFTFVLLTLAITTLIFVGVGGSFADDLLGFIGLGESAQLIWSIVRWPAALLSAMLGFSLVYYVVPDVRDRTFHLVTPGALVGVLIWLAVSIAFSEWFGQVGNSTALYGAFTGAILIVVWLWLTSVALLIGAELNHAVQEERAAVRAATEELARVPPAAGSCDEPTIAAEDQRARTVAAPGPRGRDGGHRDPPSPGA